MTNRLNAIPLLLLTLACLLVLANCKRHENPERAKGELTAKGIEFSSDAFIKSVRDGNAENVKLFLDAGISPDTRDESGSTMLMNAAIKNDFSIAQSLIDYGANVNARTNDGETTLMIAALLNAVDTVKILLAAGADLNARDNRGETPLTHARSHRHTEVTNILEQAGAVRIAARVHGAQSRTHCCW